MLITKLLHSNEIPNKADFVDKKTDRLEITQNKQTYQIAVKTFDKQAMSKSNPKELKFTEKGRFIIMKTNIDEGTETYIKVNINSLSKRLGVDKKTIKEYSGKNIEELINSKKNSHSTDVKLTQNTTDVKSVPSTQNKEQLFANIRTLLSAAKEEGLLTERIVKISEARQALDTEIKNVKKHSDLSILNKLQKEIEGVEDQLFVFDMYKHRNDKAFTLEDKSKAKKICVLELMKYKDEISKYLGAVKHSVGKHSADTKATSVGNQLFKAVESQNFPMIIESLNAIKPILETENLGDSLDTGHGREVSVGQEELPTLIWKLQIIMGVLEVCK